jgi:hypothetical protein
MEEKEIYRNGLSLCFVALVFIILSSTTTFGAVIRVRGDYSTIQAGIDAASNGDTVSVKVSNPGKPMPWIPLLLLDDKGKVTGSVTMLKNGLWLHRFSFVAQEMGDEPLGKGSLFHQRLNDDGTEILRVEQSTILYIIINGNEAWFTGPIFYDSTDPNPTRWFVVYVKDSGQPGGDNDLIWFNRVDTENEALDQLGSYDWGTYGPVYLESGDLTVQ